MSARVYHTYPLRSPDKLSVCVRGADRLEGALVGHHEAKQPPKGGHVRGRCLPRLLLRRRRRALLTELGQLVLRQMAAAAAVSAAHPLSPRNKYTHPQA